MYIVTKNNIVQDFGEQIKKLKQNTRNKEIVGLSRAELANNVKPDYIGCNANIYPAKAGYGKEVHEYTEVVSVPVELSLDGTWVWDGTEIVQDSALRAEYMQQKAKEALQEMTPEMILELAENQEEIKMAILELADMLGG